MPSVTVRAAQKHVLLVFRIDERRFGLPVERVELVLPACELTPLPGAPDAVLGLFNFHGRLMPVLDAPGRLGAGTRPLREDDLFVLLRGERRQRALRVDGALGIFGYDEDDVVHDGGGVEGTPWVGGVVLLEDDVLLIHDVDAFLTRTEEAQLAAVLAEDDA